MTAMRAYKAFIKACFLNFVDKLIFGSVGSFQRSLQGDYYCCFCLSVRLFISMVIGFSSLSKLFYHRKLRKSTLKFNRAASLRSINLLKTAMLSEDHIRFLKGFFL
jgi:hypothetical protein